MLSLLIYSERIQGYPWIAGEEGGLTPYLKF